MRFTNHLHTEIGASGIRPEGWTADGNGMFSRQAFEGDPTRIDQRLLPRIEIPGVLGFLTRQMNLDAIPEPCGKIQSPQADWDTYAFTTNMPDLGEARIDCALTQDETWVYLVLLLSSPSERDALYETVFRPVVQAFVPLKDEFELIGGRLSERGEPSKLASRLGYPADSILLIVHADDIAAHQDQSDGALDAMALGTCKTGSVMVPCPDFKRTLGIWRSRPELDLGVHLTLNCEWGTRYGWGGALPPEQIPSLYNEDGLLWGTEVELRHHMVVEEALAEMEAQIRRVLEGGAKPTHIDDHMGCYWVHPALLEGAVQLAKQYGLNINPLGIPALSQDGGPHPDAVWMFTWNILSDMFDISVRSRVYADWMRRLRPGVHLLLTHVSRMSNDYRAINPTAFFREGYHAFWANPESLAMAQELGIEFIGLRELQELKFGFISQPE